MKDKLLIRKASKDDIYRIVDLWWILESDHRARDEFYWENVEKTEAAKSYEAYIVDNLESQDHFYLVAQIDNEIAGYIHGQIFERPPAIKLTHNGKVNEILVSVGHRKKGVGKALLSFLEKEFKIRGILVMDLMVDVDNPGALSLYKDFGMYPREFHMIKKL